jgi:RNA polymerase sigma-70 factor (sigma-E family)
VREDHEFREVFMTEYGRLCRLGFLLTGDRSEAEDLAQEALAQTYRVWSQRGGIDRPGAYARQALVNRRRSLLRRAFVEARHALRLGTDGAYVPDLGEQSMVVWAALRRLSRRQRAVLVLRYYEDLTEAEVADVLGVSLGTVKSSAHRGLAKLRAELGPAELGSSDWQVVSTGEDQP